MGREFTFTRVANFAILCTPRLTAMSPPDVFPGGEMLPRSFLRWGGLNGSFSPSPKDGELVDSKYAARPRVVQFRSMPRRRRQLVATIGVAIMTMGCSSLEVSLPGLPGGAQYRPIEGDDLRVLLSGRSIEPDAPIQLFDTSLTYTFLSDGTFRRHGGRVPIAGRWEVRGSTYCMMVLNGGEAVPRWSCLPMYVDRSGSYFTQSSVLLAIDEDNSFYKIKILDVEN